MPGEARAAVADKPTTDVFVGVPTYDNMVSIRTVQGLMNAIDRHRDELTIQVGFIGSSLLAHGFNQLFAQAMCSGAKYFAMCHADIGPAEGWLETLIAELEKHEAEVVSAVVPIKSNERVYSTALGDGGEPYYRMTWGDWDKVPDTFDGRQLAEATGQKEGALLVNTGLWVCRLRRKWNRQVYFQIVSQLLHQESHVHCGVLSEDWFFSYQLNELGVKYLATKKVKLIHQGIHLWSNDPHE